MSGSGGDLSKAGRVTEIDDSFRAHVQYRSEGGRKANLYGPHRLEEREAEGDLAAMRAAAAVFPNDRVQAFHSMHAEVRRIQIRVKYARDIEMAMLRRTASIETDSEDDVDGDMFVEDPDEWWRDLQNGKTIDDEPINLKPRGPINTPAEATEHLLNTFRPLHESVGELKRLLDLRADPNAPICPGKITPLQRVMTFAPEDNAAEMRTLLLEHGAIQNKEDEEQWRIRLAAYASEPARSSAFYDDDRHLSPVGAAMDSSA